MNQRVALNDVEVRAMAGDPEAQFELGEIYRCKNVAGVLPTAADWYWKAARQDHSPALKALTLLFVDGFEPPGFQDDDRFWLEEATRCGGHEITHLRRRLDGDDDEQDINELLLEADQGNPQAQYECGIMQILGLGLSHDPDMGFHFLGEAADAGHAKAKAELESCYLFGGKPASWGAKEWLALSDEQFEPSACDYYLAYCYHMGIMFQKNNGEAARHLLRAAELGSRDAQFQLARFYYEGIGLERDLAQAEIWCSAAAAQGHKLACRGDDALRISVFFKALRSAFRNK